MKLRIPFTRAWKTHHRVRREPGSGRPGKLSREQALDVAFLGPYALDDIARICREISNVWGIHEVGIFDPNLKATLLTNSIYSVGGKPITLFDTPDEMMEWAHLIVYPQSKKRLAKQALHYSQYQEKIPWPTT